MCLTLSSALFSGPPLWKPGGIESDCRAASSHALLHHFSRCDFLGISGAWVSCLMTQGQVFLRRKDRKFFVSLGLRGHATFGWEIEVKDDDVMHITEASQPTTLACRSSLELLVQTKLEEPGTPEADYEEFLFVPTRIRRWLARRHVLEFSGFCNHVISKYRGT